MAVPKRKTSKSKRNQRRSHHALKPIFHIGFDTITGEPHLSHRVGVDGYYNGSKVIRSVERADNEDQESAAPAA